MEIKIPDYIEEHIGVAEENIEVVEENIEAVEELAEQELVEEEQILPVALEEKKQQ